MQGKGLLSICFPLTLLTFLLSYWLPLYQLTGLTQTFNLVGTQVLPLLFAGFVSIITAIIYALKNDENLGYRQHGLLRLLLSGVILISCAYLAPFFIYMYNSALFARLPLQLMHSDLKLDVYLGLFFSLSFIVGSVGVYFLIEAVRNMRTPRNISQLPES